MQARARIVLMWLCGVMGCGTDPANGGAGEGGVGDSGGDDGGEAMLGDGSVRLDDRWLRDARQGSVSVRSSGNECEIDAANLAQSDMARVTVADQTLYAGYAQTSRDNQDPVVALVDGDAVVWCMHHEDDAPDGRAVGLTWDGGAEAYVNYTIVGGGSDLEGKGGWLSSYAPGAIRGGGPKVSVLGRVDIASGVLLSSTFVIAVKMDGKVNSHSPAGAPAVLGDGSVEFTGESAHKPIGVDRAHSMTCTDYPFDTRYRFSADLGSLVCAEASNCSANVRPCS